MTSKLHFNWLSLEICRKKLMTDYWWSFITKCQNNYALHSTIHAK